MLASTQRTLNGFPSIFLDALRFLAALTVLITHTRAVWYPEGELDLLPSNISHGAVVVFFVLSGFVIAHTTTHNNRGPKEYAIARLGRLYSVYLPAILVTIICTLLLKLVNVEIYNQYHQDKTVFRFLISTVFCNEIWFFSSAPIINGPIWSLSYEFWFYVIFGCFFYRIKGVKGLILPLIVCFIAGPKILLLMFMWILGWLAYHLPRPRISLGLTWALMIILLAAAVYLMIWLPSYPNAINTAKLHWADKFLSDWAVSLLIGAIFYLLPNGSSNQVPAGIVSVFRTVADLTFPIYVMHFPFLVLFRALLLHMGDRNLQFVTSLILVFASCALIGYFLERKRKFWNNLFKSIFRFTQVYILKEKF